MRVCNQDPCEHHFGHTRVGVGGSHNNPTQQQMNAGSTTSLLMRATGAASRAANCDSSCFTT
jgi:hypothetical protein